MPKKAPKIPPKRTKMVLPKKLTPEIQWCIEELAIAKSIKRQRKKEGLDLRNVNSFTKHVKDALKKLVNGKTDKSV
jgi:hypothetical protein